MNELKIEGYIYFQTNATTKEAAMREFLLACNQAGINADNVSFDYSILHDADGNEIMEEPER